MTKEELRALTKATHLLFGVLVAKDKSRRRQPIHELDSDVDTLIPPSSQIPVENPSR